MSLKLKIGYGLIMILLIFFTCLITAQTVENNTKYAEASVKRTGEAVSENDKQKESQEDAKISAKKSEYAILVDSIRVLQNAVNKMLQQSHIGSKIEFSGFVDLNYFNNPDGDNEVDYGQFVFELSAEIYEGLAFEAELGLDEGSFAPGAGYLNYSFSNSGIFLGQFDVPFGKYWEQIPSPDRNISTYPVAIEKTTNCLNTFGANFYTSSDFTNVNAFVLNGLHGGYILGGRGGIVFNDHLEIGSSFAADFDSDKQNRSKLFGADVSSAFGIFELRSEIIWSKGIIDGELAENDQSNWGYFVENKFDIMELLNIPTAIILRYGEWNSDFKVEGEPDKIKHFDATLNYELSDQVTLKLEFHKYMYNDNEDKNIYGTQLVLSF